VAALFYNYKKLPIIRIFKQPRASGVTSSEIIKNLTEDGSLGITTYQASAYPITKASSALGSGKEKMNRPPWP